MGNSLKKAAQKKEADAAAKAKAASSNSSSANKTKFTTVPANNIKVNKVEAPKSSSVAAPSSSTSNIASSVTNTGDQQVGDYSHFNNKLSIDDFELIKVPS